MSQSTDTDVSIVQLHQSTSKTVPQTTASSANVPPLQPTVRPTADATTSTTLQPTPDTTFPNQSSITRNDDDAGARAGAGAGNPDIDRNQYQSDGDQDAHVEVVSKTFPHHHLSLELKWGGLSHIRDTHNITIGYSKRG